MPRFLQPTETGPLVTLEHGSYTLTVAPGFGARMVSFRHAGRDILRPTPDAVLAEPLVYGFAGFPLMPYSGPLFGPGFTFAGITHTLARNVREELHDSDHNLCQKPIGVVENHCKPRQKWRRKKGEKCDRENEKSNRHDDKVCQQGNRRDEVKIPNHQRQ